MDVPHFIEELKKRDIHESRADLTPLIAQMADNDRGHQPTRRKPEGHSGLAVWCTELLAISFISLGSWANIIHITIAT